MVHRLLRDDGLPDPFGRAVEGDGVVGGAAPVHHQLEVVVCEARVQRDRIGIIHCW